MTDWRISIELKQYRIEITELAESDMERAVDYIAYELKNVIAAKNILRGIRRQINSSADFSQRYELDDDELLASVGIRSVWVNSNSLYRGPQFFVSKCDKKFIVFFSYCIRRFSLLCFY